MERRNSALSDASSQSSSASSNYSEFSLSDTSHRFLNYCIVPGHRMNSKLLYTTTENYFYALNSSTKNGDNYLCIENKCSCRVFLRKDKLCVQKEKYINAHTHASQEKKFEELRVLNIIKAKCADLSSLINERKQSVRDIFYKVISEHKDVSLDFYAVERSLQIIRNKSLPKNPLCCTDISRIFEREDVHKMIGTTQRDEVFYNGCYESNEFNFCIFSSANSIQTFESRIKFGDRIFMMDGTFDVVPIGEFNQLFIIYGVYMEKVS